MIPVANPLAAYRHYQTEIDAAVLRALASGRYILGPEVTAFEQEFATWLGVTEAVGVANGTEALWLALRALELQPGDEVLVTSLTASATLAAIVEAGLRPVFVDVHPTNLNLDPVLLPNWLTPRTRAVVAVHLYGNPAPISTIAAFCHDHHLHLVEDCAQAHGAQQRGQKVGTFGEVAAWSFYPTKNLGAFGDGGLVTTNQPEIAANLRLLREYGWRERYHSALQGWNSRLDELHAAMLRVRLAHLEADNARRRAIAQAYRVALPAALRSPTAAPEDTGVEHLFVVRHPHREAFRAALRALGVDTAIQYPVPCHMQTAYAHYGGAGSLPVTEQAVREIVSLPMFPELTDEEVQTVIGAVLEAVRQVPL